MCGGGEFFFFFLPLGVTNFLLFKGYQRSFTSSAAKLFTLERIVKQTHLGCYAFCL